MSILLYHFKQLTACISEVQRIEGRESQQQEKRRGVNDKERVRKEQQEKEEEVPTSTTLP
jgi:hypothetical protein